MYHCPVEVVVAAGIGAGVDDDIALRPAAVFRVGAEEIIVDLCGGCRGDHACGNADRRDDDNHTQNAG